MIDKLPSNKLNAVNKFGILNIRTKKIKNLAS